MKKIFLLCLTIFSLSCFANEIDYEPYVCQQTVKLKVLFTPNFLKTVKSYRVKGLGFSMAEAQEYLKIDKKFQLTVCESELKKIDVIGYCYTTSRNCSYINPYVDFPF